MSKRTIVALVFTATSIAQARPNRDFKLEAVFDGPARELLADLGEARDGKVVGSLISFDNRDAGYVQDRIDSLRKEMPIVDDIAANCRGGGDAELCDLATNREAYFKKFEELQFDKIFDERVEAWTNTIALMKDEGKVAVVNYKTMTDAAMLDKKLGKELEDIGKVLGHGDSRGVINAKLGKLRTDFAAAVQAKASTNAWAAQAKDAKYQDATVSSAAHHIDGLSLVRVGATEPSWEVIRGHYDQPVQRNRYIWALLRKSGESFCRLYSLTVIEDHLGGGKYSAPRVDAGEVAEFYVSACK